jgi:hypothetical protein
MLQISSMKVTMSLKLPTTWNAIPEKNYCKISKSLHFYRKFYETMPDGKAKERFTIKLIATLVNHLLKSNNFFKRKIALVQLPLQEYEQYVSFLLTASQRTLFPKSFKRHGNTYIKPGDRLKNCSIGEFAFVDTMYFQYLQTYNENYLLLLIASLYRPKLKEKSLDDQRILFSKNYVQEHADYFKFLPRHKKIGILLAYEGCRNYMAKIYPNVFPKTQDEEEGQKKKEQKYTPFKTLIQYKIGFDPSKIDSVNKVNAHDYLSNWENELKEIKKQKSHHAIRS